MTDSTPIPVSSPRSWESRLPEWQQKFNTFCENWIFAFLVAMAIRHVALEAFRIPSASMEPMLYGDPGLMKGDFVVVDKLFCRFTGVRRWDVTVFQFPQPEVEAPGNDARPAVDANGDRLDVPMLRPLMYRNFVKRAVVLPGDTFFIRSGNIYLKQPDGTFQASRRSAEIQEHLWQEIYRHGAQSGYLPWQASTGAAVTVSGDSVAFTCANGGNVAFTQPLRNLYMKPGTFRVRALGSGEENDEFIDLSMTTPVFTYRRDGRTGNAWYLDQWNVSRMNSADLDNKSRGTCLNNTMDEWVGDVRLQAKVEKLEGNVSLVIRAGGTESWQLTLVPAGWQVEINGKAISEGIDAPIGADISFAHLDDQVVVTIGGKEVCRHDVAPLDPDQRVAISVAGNGAVTLAPSRIDRDIHYARRGFMLDGTSTVRAFQSQVDNSRGNLSINPVEVDKIANYLTLVGQVRAQMLSRPEDALTSRERVAPIGTGPDNAITAPPGAYLMMGDNSPQSWDGREWGWVPAENIRGRALLVAFPPGRWRLVR